VDEVPELLVRSLLKPRQIYDEAAHSGERTRDHLGQAVIAALPGAEIFAFRSASGTDLQVMLHKPL
jgi:hypothetical protein